MLFNNRPSNSFTSNCSLFKWLSQCIERGDLFLVWPCAWPAGDTVFDESENNKVINSPCFLINVCHNDEARSCKSESQKHTLLWCWISAYCQQCVCVIVSFFRWKSTPPWTWPNLTLWTMSWDVGANMMVTELTCMDVMQVRTDALFRFLTSS